MQVFSYYWKICSWTKGYSSRGYVTEALRCNGFVDGPVSLQLTGHPFAKPHVPCVVANRKQVCVQLCFVHERASTSSCWSVKFLCKHEICTDLAWRVNCNSNSAGSFYVISYYTLLWKTCSKCPAREIHSPSSIAAILTYPWTVTVCPKKIYSIRFFSLDRFNPR